MKTVGRWPKLRARLAGSRWTGYAAATGGTALAAWLRWELARTLGEGLPAYITFYPVVIFSALFSGAAAGILATLLSACAATLFFLEPLGSVRIARSADMVSMGFFIAVNLLISLVAGALRDARHRALAQAQLAAVSEQRYRSFVEATAHVIWGTDASGQVDRPIPTWNAYTGQQDHEAAGFGWMNAIHPDDRPKVTEAWKAASAARTQYEVEYRLKRHDGQWRHILARGVPVLAPDGSVREYIGTCIDVTDQRHAEDVLRHNEQRFRTLTEASSQIVWVSTPRGEPAADSPSWREFTGRPLEQWRNWAWLEAIHPDDRQRVAAVWRNALERNQSYRDEYRLLHLSGLYREVLARAVPVRNADGTVREWVGTLTDITNARRAEIARATLASIIADSDDAVISKGLDGRITSWNRGAERLFGYSADQVLGQDIRLLIPPERQPEEDHLLEAICRGEKTDHYESQRKTRAGRLIDVSITTSPIRDSMGQIVGASKIARDITPRKQAELALRESEERLRIALEAAQLGTWDYDTRTHEVFGDERAYAFFAVPQTRLAFRDLLTAIHSADRARVEHAVQAALAPTGPGHYDMHHRVVWPDGTIRWLALKGRVHFQGAGAQRRAVRFIGTVADISEQIQATDALRRAKEDLARANADLEQQVQQRTTNLQEALADLEHMSYSMVHDMRAPLRAMQTFSTLAEEECAACGHAQTHDYFRRIRNAATRLDRLVTDALHYNKLVREQPAATPVDLGRLLRGMLESYPNLQSSVANVQLDFQQLLVLGNESLLTQSFGNLLDNAVKFVAPGVRPRIRLWAEEMRSAECGVWPEPPTTPHAPCPTSRDSALRTPHAAFVRVWIEDNGLGIPKDAQEKIFLMFQRMHRENEYPGTGIGLAIVRKAVERMGGHVGLESEPGHGSKFWVELLKAVQVQSQQPLQDAA